MHLLQLFLLHLLVHSASLSGMKLFQRPYLTTLPCLDYWLMWVCCSAVLAHIILQEKLHIFGILGCALCVVGSTTIVLHAPQEREIESVREVWDLATEPGRLIIKFPKIFLFIILHIRSIFYILRLKPCIFLAAFLFYATLVIAIVLILIFHYIPQYGQTHILFYIGVCSLVGSLSVCLPNFQYALFVCSSIPPWSANIK